eukprot:3414778-Amphidinium_carterae.1
MQGGRGVHHSYSLSDWKRGADGDTLIIGMSTSADVVANCVCAQNGYCKSWRSRNLQLELVKVIGDIGTLRFKPESKSYHESKRRLQCLRTTKPSMQ